MTVLWDAAYDLDGEDITYEFILARDLNFTDVIYREENIRLPEASFDTLPPGQYFIRVQAKNESGYVQDCYDYYNHDRGKVYGCFAFRVDPDGAVIAEKNVE